MQQPKTSRSWSTVEGSDQKHQPAPCHITAQPLSHTLNQAALVKDRTCYASRMNAWAM